MHPNAIVDFLVGLLADPAAHAAYVSDPQAVLDASAVGGLITPAEVAAALPTVTELFGTASAIAVDAAAVPVEGFGTADLSHDAAAHSAATGLAGLDLHELFGNALFDASDSVLDGFDSVAGQVDNGVDAALAGSKVIGLGSLLPIEHPLGADDLFGGLHVAGLDVDDLGAHGLPPIDLS